jgi:hypothetical protein
MSEDDEWNILEQKLRKLNRLTEEVSKIVDEQKPVAWRKKFNGQWHYLNENDPFPADDWEPLYVRNKE